MVDGGSPDKQARKLERRRRSWTSWRRQRRKRRTRWRRRRKRRRRRRGRLQSAAKSRRLGLDHPLSNSPTHHHHHHHSKISNINFFGAQLFRNQEKRRPPWQSSCNYHFVVDKIITASLILCYIGMRWWRSEGRLVHLSLSSAMQRRLAVYIWADFSNSRSSCTAV